MSKEGFSLPGEAEDKCCWCVPLKPGVMILGIWMIAYAVLGILDGVNFLKTEAVVGILMFVSVVPICIGALYFIQYFRNDTAETRGGLTKACMMMILALLISLGVQLFSVIFGSNTFGNLLSQIITTGISCLCFFYYAGVCKRFASQG